MLLAAVLGALGPLTAEASPGDPLIAVPPGNPAPEPVPSSASPGTEPSRESGQESRTDEQPDGNATKWPIKLQWSRGSAKLSFEGRLHLDARIRAGGRPLADFAVRRARATLRLSLFDERLTTEISPDFGEDRDLADAFADVKIRPWFRVRAGQMIVPISAHRSLSSNELRHPERPVLIETLFQPREVGAKVWGEVSDGRLFYDLGVFDGPIGTRGPDEVSVVSQLTVVPIEPLTVWGGYRVWPTAAGSAGLQSIQVFRLITFFEPAQELEASGPRHQVSTGPIVRFGPVELWGEMVYDRSDRVRTPDDASWRWTQWSAVGDATVVLTGEKLQAVGDVEPERPLLGTAAPGPGAFALSGRYELVYADGAVTDGPENLDVDPVVAGGLVSGPGRAATTAHIGHGTLIWTLAAGVRALASYGYARFDRAVGVDAGVVDNEAHVVIMRFDVHF